MAVGDKGDYRLKQIQMRAFYQTGQKSGLHKHDIEPMFNSLALQIDDAIAQAAVCANNSGIPNSIQQSQKAL